MSELRTRLAHLRGEAGCASGSGPPEVSATEVSDLRRRLGRLRAAHRTQPPVARARVSDETLAARLGGRVVSDGLIVVEEAIPLGTRHGATRLGHHLESAIRFFAGEGAQAGEDTVFMDTETTGLSGGTGTVVFLLGLARRTRTFLHVTQLFLTGFRGEATMLRSAAERLRAARVLVTYNGKSFDHPLLSARYRLLGLDDPFAPLAHVDLLHATRRAFGRRWDECTLRAAEHRLLAFRRRHDIPGEQIPATWFRWVRHGASEDLHRVVTHNRHDVVTLTALLPTLHRCYESPAETGADVLALARHYHRQFDETRSYAYLREHRAHLERHGLLELARLSRRRGEREAALAIWRELAARHDATALECLAKHYEHLARDLHSALSATRELLAVEPDAPSHRRREARLLAKLGSAGASGR